MCSHKDNINIGKWSLNLECEAVRAYIEQSMEEKTRSGQSKFVSSYNCTQIASTTITQCLQRKYLSFLFPEFWENISIFFSRAPGFLFDFTTRARIYSPDAHCVDVVS